MPLQIFVSYARNDDLAPLQGGSGFVTTLLETLEQALKIKGPPIPTFWRDTRAIRKSRQFEPKLQEEIDKSDLLLVVLSNNWLNSDWCRNELELFEARWRREGERALKERIVVVSKHDIPIEQRPRLLQGQDTYKFVEFFGARGKTGTQFDELADELARDLREHVSELTALVRSPVTVYVAKPSRDMLYAYEQVTTELQRRGYRVVPPTDAKIPSDDSAVEFIDDALKDARVSVHLLGDEPGFTPEGVDEPIVGLQLSRAGNRAKRIIWGPKRPLAIVKRLGRVLPTDTVESGDIDLIFSHIPAIEVLPRLGMQSPQKLPEEVSSFVGRKAEVKHLNRLLQVKRLVSIVGPAGVGKTRLALHVAREIERAAICPAWFVELNALTGNDVAAAVANAMNLPISGRDPFQSIAAHIGKEDALIVLDNSENVIGGCARFASAFLRASPAARLLVTSRERLHIDGEQVFSLTPLPTPARTMSLEELRKCDSVKLLLDRAASSTEHFRLTELNCADIRRICEQLDGIPLAIELAAARLSSFSPSDVAKRLAVENPHRTVRGTIEWSYGLLDDYESRLFARLAVFRGQFGLDAIESICCAEPIGTAQLLETLQALVDKSFVVPLGTGTSTRFKMLHIIRSYAEERLNELDECEDLVKAHFTYHRMLVNALTGATGTAQTQALDALDVAHADVTAALQWACANTHPDLPAIALTLAAFWHIRGYLAEGAQQLETIASNATVAPENRTRLLVRASGLRNAAGEHDAAQNDAEVAIALCEKANPDGLASALGALAAVFLNSGAYQRAQELYSRALPLEASSSDNTGTIRCLINLGIAQAGSEDFASANATLESAIPLAEAAGQTTLAAWAYGAMGHVAHQSGELQRAMEYYRVCLDLSRSINYKNGIAQALNHMAQVALLQSSIADVRTLVEESLRIAWEHDLPHELADALEVVARLMVLQSRDAAAAHLFGAVDALRSRIRFPFTQAEQRARRQAMDPLVERHDAQWLRRECEAGASQPLESILRIARSALLHARPAMSWQR